ncbi:MAG: V-type ATP synthase subunit D [Synergistetes bacterium]|nr:V-type ATP synthase subunit D [Synergistota bacterium]MCX8127997.1 V-type ATP synthase subunit D [Synergistota bacterium]MDW8192808.1 V-type ATP synthase subunit D [Synergistota bacterium]
MKLRVNPNRMELLRLRRRLAIAKRGHKLLKDKQDALIKQFIQLVRESRSLREELERELQRAYVNFLGARAVMSSRSLEEALLLPGIKSLLKISKVNMMSVFVPKFDFFYEGDPTNYGFWETSGELDVALYTFINFLPKLIKLAEMEKAVILLADEIERTRRRVNALEYVLIPGLEEAISFITMKLDEMERAALTRLMKIKEIVRKH